MCLMLKTVLSRKHLVSFALEHDGSCGEAPESKGTTSQACSLVKCVNSENAGGSYTPWRHPQEYIMNLRAGLPGHCPGQAGKAIRLAFGRITPYGSALNRNGRHGTA